MGHGGSAGAEAPCRGGGKENISLKTGEDSARIPLKTRNSTSRATRIMVPSSYQNSASCCLGGSCATELLSIASVLALFLVMRSDIGNLCSRATQMRLVVLSLVRNFLGRKQKLVRVEYSLWAGLNNNKKQMYMFYYNRTRMCTLCVWKQESATAVRVRAEPRAEQITTCHWHVMYRHSFLRRRSYDSNRRRCTQVRAYRANAPKGPSAGVWSTSWRSLALRTSPRRANMYHIVGISYVIINTCIQKAY